MAAADALLKTGITEIGKSRNSMIKTGEQHIASLRDGREVYLDGELV